jgi:hypothetical protein
MAASDTSIEEDILTDAQEAFKEAQDHENRNREAALEDIRFARLGEQWPEAVRRDREKDARPCLTINSLPSFIRQVVNDARQNKPGINVHPVDSQADPETADIFNGLIRQIEQSSDAEVAYDTALDFAVTGGFGYFKINTRYATDDTFDQDIVIERVANPFSIYGDPNSTEADSSDWATAFELDQMSKKAFEKRWKDADAVSFDSMRPIETRTATERVQIAAHWTREDSRKQIVAVTMPDPNADPMQVAMAMKLGVSDQLIIDLDIYEENSDLFQALGMQVQGSPRDVPCWKVTQRILSGADVLETIDWAGKFIPIIPVYGEEVNVEGERHLRGLVRDAKDPQRMFNYWRTTSTELVALAPRAPFIGKKGAFETDKAKWDTINTQNWSTVTYDGAEKPERQPFSGVPAGAIQEATNASDDIKRILGLYNASLGAQGNETSGRAILARQKEGDVSTFHFIDNLSRAIRHAGRVIIDLIPKTYSTARIIRIIGEDGKQQAVNIAPSKPLEDDSEGGAAPAMAESPNGPMPMQGGAQAPIPPQGQQAPIQGLPGAAAPMGQPMLDPAMQQQLAQVARVYDLTVGKYDLTVQAGPAYSTQREELNTVLVELIRAFPAGAPVLMDLVVKSFDMPDADEVAKRLQALMPPAAQGPNPQMQQMQQQFQAAIDQAHGQLQQMGQKLQAAQQAAQEAAQDQQQKAVENQLRQQELQLKTYEAQTDRMQAETDAQRAAKEAQQPVQQPFGVAA